MLAIDTIINTGLKIIEKVIPDPQAQMEAQQKLLELQQSGELKLEEFDVKREEIEKDDRLSARELQNSALAQDDILAKRFIYYFTIFWSVTSASYIGFITFCPIPESNVRFADTILGFILGTAVASMFSYFYGSTSNSKVKDNVIKEMMRRHG